MHKFYKEILPKYKSDKVYSIHDAIGDLPPLYPVKAYKDGKRNVSHEGKEKTNISWHVARYQNEKRYKCFKKLTKDIEEEKYEYRDTKKLIKLYETTGRDSVHKYHVLIKNEPSTTILADLYKNGFRFIHYYSKQARTLTVREAARIQTFDDDYEFADSMAPSYKMIGNAVPPLFAKKLSEAVHELLSYIESVGDK